MFKKKVIPVLVALVAPLLMAHGNPVCPDCPGVNSWSGSLAASALTSHSESVEQDVEYLVELHPTDDAGLLISGVATDVSCEVDQLVHQCSFTASCNGSVSLRVAAGPSAIDYDLYLLLPE